MNIQFARVFRVLFFNACWDRDGTIILEKKYQYGISAPP